MAQIQTARGPIYSSELGATLMHEHVFVPDTEILQNYPEDWGDEEKRISDAVVRLNELKSRGVDTIVDLTVIVWAAIFLESSGLPNRRNSTSSLPRGSTRIMICRFTSISAVPARCWLGRN
jgi:hypothetical protein